MVVEYRTERGSVYHQNVHIPITRPAKAVHTKKRNVMNSVVQVTTTVINKIHKYYTRNNTTEKPYWGEWQGWTVCSKKCGGGISYRKRKCYESKCPHPYYKNCNGSSYEEKKCNEHCCQGSLRHVMM